MALIGSFKTSLHSPVAVYTCVDSFLSSLRANLQISFEDLSAASHLDHYHSVSNNYGLPPYADDVTFFSGFADDLEDPPSPTDTCTTSSTAQQSFATPQTWTYHASTADDRQAALSLIADSIREQRRNAIQSILLHPASLAVAFLLLLVLTRSALNEPQRKGPMACCIGAVSLVAAFIITERATRTYLTMASAVDDPAWLREGLYQRNNHHNSVSNGSAGGSLSKHHHSHSHHNSMPTDDEILVTKDQNNEIIAALVLRTARTNALSSGAPSANGMRALRHRHSNSTNSLSFSGRLTGVIRAWTVKKSHRQQGLGLDLLEAAVSICRVRRLDGPIFADDGEKLSSAHVPGFRTLWWPFNKGFEMVEERAKEGLKAVIEGKERKN